MIRLVFALRRKPTLSRAEFQDYWLNKHAPLVASFASDLDILRYVQTHTLTDPANAAAQRARGDMESEYDGVAELWWASEADLTENLRQNEAAQKAGAALLEDEAKFIDLPNSPLWFAYEYPQINPSPENVMAKPKSNVVRVFFPLRHQNQIDEADARHYWLTHHGPIVRSHGQATGTQVDSYLGHAEAWIDRGNAPRTEEAKKANAAFIEDEHTFIDMPRSTIFFGKEHSIIDKR